MRKIKASLQQRINLIKTWFIQMVYTKRWPQAKNTAKWTKSKNL